MRLDTPTGIHDGIHAWHLGFMNPFDLQTQACPASPGSAPGARGTFDWAAAAATGMFSNPTICEAIRRCGMRLGTPTETCDGIHARRVGFMNPSD